jgi:CheY-like chemotaxis protein
VVLSEDPYVAGGSPGSDRPDQVLVVDDEPLVRHFTSRVLLEQGYAVHEATDGVEAMAILDSGRTVDCVVSDVVMPRLDGVKLLETLSLRRPGLPVILMSAYGSAQLAERGLAAPCAVLRKPFAPERLLQEVRRCIATRA